MPYAILKPDGSLHRIEWHDLPGGSTDYAAYGVLPVDVMIPVGMSRIGWEVVDGAARPILVPTVSSDVPSEVGSGQIRAAMVELEWAADEASLDATILAAIDLVIPPGKDREKAKILYRNASVWKRDQPFVALVGAAMGKTSAQIDQLFRVAFAI